MRFARVVGVVALLATGIATASAPSRAMPPAALKTFLVQSRSPSAWSHARLAVMSADGSVVRVLAQSADQFGDRSPVSPNGKLVAYGDASGLVVERIDGSHRHVVVPPPRSCHSWACAGTLWVWSPFSNALLATGAGENGSKHLNIVSAEGGKAHRVVGPQRDTRFIPLAWSGPVHKIAYLAWRSPAVGLPFLAIAGVTGQSQQVICTACVDGMYGLTATSSPNGRWLGYTDLANGGTELLDLTTGTKVDVPGAYGSMPTGSAPLWAPDSREFAIPTSSGVTFYTTSGRVVATAHVAYPSLWAWDTTGLYVTPGNVPRTLQVIRPGQTTASTVFTMPRRQGILSVAPLQ